jgi:hypothetical protein
MHEFLLWTYANTIKKVLAADGVFLLSLEYQYCIINIFIIHTMLVRGNMNMQQLPNSNDIVPTKLNLMSLYYY